MWSTDICPSHLYIHWPFCKKKCHYCDFVAFEKHEQFTRQYHESLCKEILAFASRFDGPASLRPIRTIFFGGGTPSLYPPQMLEELFSVLNENFDLSVAEEISLEVNPGGISNERLALWKRLGINRLSIGVQVLDDAVLANLNRAQTNQDVYELFERAPKYFDNMSADLIMGLPGVTEKIWRNTLDYITSQSITHVSVYLLTIHEKTPLYYRLKKGELSVGKDEAFVKTFEHLVPYLENKGFEQYEISNYAKPGFSSVHNQAYWNRMPYKGFGVGAASFNGKSREVNSKNFTKYTDKIARGEEVVTFREELNDQQVVLESLMLGLRQRAGLGLHRMIYLLEQGLKRDLEKKIMTLKEHKLIQEQEGNIRLTRRGMALENEVVLALVS